MVLTSSDYETIIKEYSETQKANADAWKERREMIYKEIPKLKELDKKREKLLEEHSFPADTFAPVYSCELCHDTGYVGADHCICFQRKAARIIYAREENPDILETENFQTLDMSLYPEDLHHSRTGKSARQIMECAVASCKQFADDYKSGRQSDCLLLTGRPGVGKTFLAHCIAKELIDKGLSVIYYSAGDLFDKLAKSKFSKTENGAEYMMDDEYLSGYDLLIIDDLGTEMVNAFVRSTLFRILNNRIKNGLGIIISTNLSAQELSRTYSERISSRILESFKLIVAFGSDIRVQKRLRE